MDLPVHDRREFARSLLESVRAAMTCRRSSATPTSRRRAALQSAKR